MADGRARVKLTLSVEACQQQQVRAIGAVRASCPLSMALSDAQGGATSASAQLSLEGAAATTDLALGAAVKQGMRAFGQAMKGVLATTERADAGD